MEPLVMKAQYTDSKHGTLEIDTPFKELNIDEPLVCAKYIRDYNQKNGAVTDP